MKPNRLMTFTFLVAGALAAGFAADLAAEVPPRTDVGQTLAVPDADFDRGQIFYLLPGQDTQLALTSSARLQRLVITTSRAIGYVVATFDPEDTDQPILGGALRVPVASLTSDSPTFDTQLWGENFFHGAEHSEITFELTGTSGVQKLDSEDEDIFAFRMKLTGKLTALGTSQAFEMDADVGIHLTTFSTFPRSVGDLITLSGQFEITPSDFGWKMPARSDTLIAPKLTVDVFLTGSTRSPENFLNPNVDAELLRAEQRYLTQARDFRDAEAAAAVGTEFLAEYHDSASALGRLARIIVTESGLPHRDLQLARQLVERIRELDPESQDTAEIFELVKAASGHLKPEAKE